MKKIIFSILILIPFFGFNQVINHFDDSSSKWYVASNFMNANQENPTHLGVKTKIWGFVGDTLIESQNWLKIYSTSDSTFQNDLDFQGFIRTDESKVFYKETGSSPTRELYDFDIEVGDTFEFNINIYGTYHEKYQTVIEIDTVEINGVQHKRIKFSNELPDGMVYIPGTLFKEEWIEGIGSLKSPIFPANGFTIDTEWGEKVDLTCSFVNETQYFHNDEYSECFIYDVLGLKEIHQNHFEIFPNPVENQLNIKTTQNGVYNIEIINSQGETIIKTELNGAKSTINVENLKNGIYFIKIENNNSLQTIKFIKE